MIKNDITMGLDLL